MGSCAFDKLFHKSVPHILETVFFSLDYESYKKCLEVGRTWNELLTSERYLKMGKSVFQEEISENERELSRAAARGDAAKVKTLLRSGMLDVNSRNGYFFNKDATPLHKAANKGHRIVVKLLINRGADPNARDPYGETPLQTAAFYGHKDAVKLLLNGGADPNGSDENGETPLHAAERYSRKEVVQLLLQEGAEVNKPNKNGLTPLHYAAIHGYKEMVQILLEWGAEVNKPNRYGETPLHYAAAGRHGNKDIVQILLKNGAIHNATDKDGHTPLSLAEERGHTDIANIIMRYNTKNDDCKIS